MKTEHPILFRAEMVRAILEGRKTQTRRILVPQPTDLPAGAYCDPYNKNPEHFTFWTADHKMILGPGGNIKGTAHWRCPHGIPGHTLWVKETYLKRLNGEGIIYRADLDPVEAAGVGAMYGNWKPSIFMPRWASRINLKIESIRVERVRDITEEDAIAEGVLTLGGLMLPESPVKKFERLWDTMRAGTEFAWACNPWNWVITFPKHQQN